MQTVHFGSYAHSDAVTSHKGGALVLASGSADFAGKAARLCYGAGANSWADVALMFPDAAADAAARGDSVKGIRLLRLDGGEAGRVEVKVGETHAVIVKVLSTTDFAAKTDVFKQFTAAVTEAALEHDVHFWGTLVAIQPSLEGQHLSLVRKLKEPIQVSQIEILAR